MPKAANYATRLPERVQAIVREAAHRHSVEVNLLLSDSQRRVAVEARRTACRALRARGFAYSQIGYWLDRHHSSIVHLLGERDSYVAPPDTYDPKAPDESGVWAI